MSLAIVGLIGVLFAAGTYLLLQRTITRIIIGLGLIGNGTNLLLMATGGRPGATPVAGGGSEVTDPVPQALVLTAIVIGFAITSFLLALAWRNWTLDGNDEVEDDISDRRIARAERDTEADGAGASDERGDGA
ncbi:MAG: Na(+)/H(+) antiporter subunit C [Acidimicrobiales bacterium]|nr:Na(+)/H(+) antiporter subunit C [Acidimicrobiales bacterium]